MPLTHDPLLKTADAAAALNVGTDKVLQLFKEGKLRGSRFGPRTVRIFQSSVDSLIREGAEHA